MTYTLYVDEMHANGPYQNFILAGIAFESSYYEKMVVPIINDFKRGYHNESFILHEQSIFAKKYGTPYYAFKDKALLDQYWQQFCSTFQGIQGTIFTVVIKENSLKKQFKDMNDIYHIAMQLLLESYCTFLIEKNTFGDVMFESRKSRLDEKLLEHCNFLRAMGTVLYPNHVFAKRVTTISFPKKIDNIIGLQLADAIPNSLNRYLSNMDQRISGLLDIIQSKFYTKNSIYRHSDVQVLSSEIDLIAYHKSRHPL
ncbi:DUF3800 domain-containing protein [Risungbinella massiliensis]|uniref:DUF3800 domain-containing protein n=1 Tax=Risungbinella massiliensis TaxID=1329796 RepID=UPI0005CC670E|nr:DUF3800 domain-containing protein [Risungbinella massiliensis]